MLSWRHFYNVGNRFGSVLCKGEGRPCRAGLRSGDKFNPFPKEMNRRLTGTEIALRSTIRQAENLQKKA